MARMRREGDPKNKKTATNLYSCCRTRFACDQVVYSLSRGINVFDYSNSLKMVATGGGWGVGRKRWGYARVRVGWMDMGSSGEKVASPQTRSMV